MTRKLTDDEIIEMNVLREPTVEQLEFFAEICECKNIELYSNYVIVTDGGCERWDPLNNDKQNHRLLKKLIALKDCEIFYDMEVNEYFVYQFIDDYKEPLSHRKELNEAVVEAAMEVWFPKEKGGM